jgi:hypothetical protein
MTAAPERAVTLRKRQATMAEPWPRIANPYTARSATGLRKPLPRSATQIVFSNYPVGDVSVSLGA